MKILIINKYLYNHGGDTTYTFNLGNLLKKHGHHVFYWGMKNSKNLVNNNKEYFPSFIDYNELNDTKSISNGMKVLKRSVYSFEVKKQMAIFLEKINPDIVHLNNIHSHLTPSIIDSINIAKIPIVWTLHDFELICPNIHFLNNGKVCEDCKVTKYYMATINRCKKNSFSASLMASIKSTAHYSLNIKNKISSFIIPSKFMKNKFVEYGWPSDKFYHMRNFLPNNNNNNNVPLNDDSYIIYFGGLNKWKGVWTLLKAANHIKDIKVIFLGDGSERQMLKEYAHDNNIINVSFLGHLSGESLTSIIAGAKFSIVPSECYENCPYSILESYSFGVPVIGANIGGIPELIENGKTGFLFKSGDALELSEKIKTLYQSPELVDEFSNNAKKFSEDNFSSVQYYNALLNIYQTALS